MLGVELYLDDESERRIRGLWAELDARGVASLGAAPGATYRPHVSLAVLEDMDVGRLAAALVPMLGTCRGMPLTLASLGFFPGTEPVAYLGVTPTEQLLRVHREVHEALSGISAASWSMYEPGSFVPHCTLAMDVGDPATVFAAARAMELPVVATAREVHVVDVASGCSRARLV